MRFHALAVSVFALATGCASSPPAEPEGPAGPQLMPAGYSTGASTTASTTSDLCQPRIVDDRTVLSDNCINVIDRSPAAGRQIKAVGRETKALRSLCENMVLPKCRRKY